jgi:beta-galactosidase
VKRDRNHPAVIMWSIGNEVGERSGISDGYAWAHRQADLVRRLDPTRPVSSAVPALFEELIPLVDEQDLDKLYDFLSGEQPDPQHDRWGEVTEPFGAALDVFGYNYLLKRYEGDGEKFPGRVMAGTETFPHWAFAFWKETERHPYLIGDFVWTALDYLGEAGIGKVSYDGEAVSFGAKHPYHLANCGDFDICGFKRPQSYFRDILWGVRQEPFIAVIDPQDYGREIRFNPWGWEPVIDSWTFPGREGRPTRVEVYSADEEVELLVNGVSLGRQPAGADCQNKAVFEVRYEAGTLTAVGYNGGQESSRTSLATAAEPAAVRLTPDRETLKAEYGDLAYVTVEIVDENGAVTQPAGQEVWLEISGSGELLAVGTADPVSEEPYVGERRKAFQGRLMAVVRSSGEEGEIVLKARAEGLAAGETRLRAKA